MEENKLDFNFLKDTPVGKNQEEVFEFYHKYVAPALKEILDNNSCVHTIGLFSKWGSGKSSIIEMIREETACPIFVFDVWKYQDDSLRRTFLIEFVKFLDIDSTILECLYTNTSKTIKDQIKKDKTTQGNRILKTLKNNWLLISSLALILVAAVLNRYFGDTSKIIKAIKDFANGVGALVLVASAFKPIVEKIWKNSIDKFLSSLTPLSEIKTKIVNEDRLNSPEQFENLFKKIITKIDKKIIIVFDNIDRVQGDTAIKILSTIKTFLDPAGSKGLIFIVPCDSDAINKQIESFYKEKNIELDNFDISEYLRKLFNVIIWLPEFIGSDFRLYIEKLMENAGTSRDLIKQEEVIDVIAKAFPNNPREIKQFINNLIASLILASKTNVWDRIKTNIPYLTKVLVIKQKFPLAYSRLKENWFKPENILFENDHKEFMNFMLNTSNITVSNAEPFIYFKEPVISNNLLDSEALTLSLVGGDVEKTKSLIEAENDKSTVAGFIQELIEKYKNQTEILFNIVHTHLHVFHHLKINIPSKLYYQNIENTLEKYLWQFFEKLDTNIIFSDIIASTNLDNSLRDILIERYILSLGNENMKTKKNNLAKNIIENLNNYRKLLNSKQKDQLSKRIESAFSSSFEILSIFKSTNEQKMFISNQTLITFISNINITNFSNSAYILIDFKKFIGSDINNINLILQKIADIIEQETNTNSGFRVEKENIMEITLKLFGGLEGELKKGDEDIKSRLGHSLIRFSDTIGDWNQRSCVINNIRWFRLFTSDNPLKDEFYNYINNYFQNASTQEIEKALSYWNEGERALFISDYFNILSAKSMRENGLLYVIYNNASQEIRSQILFNLINEKGAQSLDFINQIKKLPNRQAIARNLLEKAASLELEQQAIIFVYLPKYLNKKDPSELKDLLVSSIKNLLKADNPRSQEIGFNLLSQSEFLSDEKKREIGQDVLDWLRQPGKQLNSTHRFSLKSVEILVKILQQTPIKDFVYTLFSLLKQDKDRPTLEVALEILGGVKPDYLSYEKDYRDLLARLNDWTDNENKNLIISGVKLFKREKLSKEEKDFWNELEKINKIDEKSE